MQPAKRNKNTCGYGVRNQSGRGLGHSYRRSRRAGWNPARWRLRSGLPAVRITGVDPWRRDPAPRFKGEAK